jgi:hypothetical protein
MNEEAMTSKWMVAALLFSVAVNVAVVGTLAYYRHIDQQPMHLKLRHGVLPPNPDFFRFQDMQTDPVVAREMDSLQQQYGEQLKNLHRIIDQRRNAIVLQLQQEPVNRDTLDKLITHLSEDQVRAERLTVDHLLVIKPFLPKEKWQMIIRELEEPPRMIKTITIDNDSTPDGRLNRKEIKKVLIFNPDKK